MTKDINKAFKAFKTLGLNKEASDEEIKKAYRDAAKKYHPDVYKEDPNKFKEINAANDLIKEYKNNPRSFQQNPFAGGGFAGYQNININDFVQDFFRSNHQEHERQEKISEPPTVHISISFVEAVLGCDKEIKYTRYLKCNKCDGEGIKREGNGCGSCDGFGKSTTITKNARFIKSCGKCHGKNIKTFDCETCKTEGLIDDSITGSLHIPGGRHTGDTLRLQGKGHYMGEAFFGSSYSDVFVIINVEKDNELELIGNDVVSNVNISLLEALSGCEKTIKTIQGNKQISINKLAKNKDNVILNGLGVPNVGGNHKIIVNVEYPNQEVVDKLVEAMK